MKKNLLFIIFSAVLFSCADYGLFEKDPDPVVLTIGQVTDTSVVLSWTKSTSEVFAYYKVYYSTEISPIDTTAIAADTIYSALDTFTTIKKLLPATHYSIRVCVFTEGHTYSWSNQCALTTQNDKRSLTLFPVDSIADSVISLRFSRCIQSEVRKYVVYYDTITTKVDSAGIPMGKFALTSATDTTCNLRGLQYAKTYYVKVHAFNGLNTIIASSNLLTIEMPLKTPIASILYCDSSSDSVAYLRFTHNRDGDFAHYALYQSTRPLIDTSDSLVKTLLPSTDTAISISGLSSDSLYWFVLASVNDKNRIVYSNRVSNIPVLLYITTATDSGVSLKWTQCPSSHFTGYKLFRDTVNILADNILTPIKIFGQQEVLQLDYLDSTVTASKTYWYRLFVYETIPQIGLVTKRSNAVHVRL